MSLGKWFGGGTIVLALGAAILVRQCAPIVLSSPAFFTYGAHERPRVFVSHHPLIPGPGASLTVRLAPDLPSGITVQRAAATLRNPADGTTDTRPCSAVPNGAFECTFTLGPSQGFRVYGGSLELSNGERVNSRAEYRFTVVAQIAPNSLIEARAPLNATTGLADTYRVDTALARDPENYALAAFIGDAENSVYDGILADPIYRWRDNQLGFFVFTREAFVTSYYSGLDTRCGKNPWPLEAALPAQLGAIEVLGVLHRKAANTQGIEGGVTGPTVNLFRDCAGRAMRDQDVATFSASTGFAESPFIAKHEFGHAAFGLGDEYTEPDSTRRVQPAVIQPNAPGCCCLVDGGGGETIPGGGVTPGGGASPGTTPVPTPTPKPTVQLKRCFGPEGRVLTTPVTGIAGSLPICSATNSMISQSCGARPDGGCPPLAGDCVSNTAWLGAAAPSGADTARPNVFPTEQACTDAVPRARDHPAVEDHARSIGVCRELCGPNTTACPCGAPQYWYADIDPALAPATSPDSMSTVSATGKLHGGTCIWCVETALCVRWHRSLGDDAQKTWDACQAPLKDATGFERWWRALVHWIAELIAAILRIIVF